MSPDASRCFRCWPAHVVRLYLAVQVVPFQSRLDKVWHRWLHLHGAGSAPGSTGQKRWKVYVSISLWQFLFLISDLLVSLSAGLMVPLIGIEMLNILMSSCIHFIACAHFSRFVQLVILNESRGSLWLVQCFSYTLSSADLHPPSVYYQCSKISLVIMSHVPIFSPPYALAVLMVRTRSEDNQIFVSS